MHKIPLRAAPRLQFLPRRAWGPVSFAPARAVCKLVMLTLVVGALPACGGDGANPFESDKAAIQPVDCAGSAPACV